jgi:hypothetical protein
VTGIGYIGLHISHEVWRNIVYFYMLCSDCTSSVVASIELFDKIELSNSIACLYQQEIRRYA